MIPRDALENVAATLAIENLYPDQELVDNMTAVAEGNMTEEEVLNKLHDKYYTINRNINV